MAVKPTIGGLALLKIGLASSAEQRIFFYSVQIIYKDFEREDIYLVPLLKAKKMQICEKMFGGLLLLPDPFRGMGAWRNTMEPQKPENFPEPRPQVVKRQESPNSERCKESIAGQFRMR